MARPAIVIALPVAERKIVADELRAAGFEAISIGAPDELEALLEVRQRQSPQSFRAARSAAFRGAKLALP